MKFESRLNKRYNVIIIVIDDLQPIILDAATGKRLKPFLRVSNTGLRYPALELYDHLKGKWDKPYVHRMVCYSYNLKGEYDPTKVVDHINGDVLNYHPSNLRYLTRSDNAKNLVGNMGNSHIKEIEDVK